MNSTVAGLRLRVLAAQGVDGQRTEVRACGWEHLDDFHQLVDARLAGEEGLSQEQFGHDAAHTPDVDGRCVVRGAEDELRGAVVPTAREQR